MPVYPIPVVGESFDNEDGTSRQAEIARCIVLERVKLIREPDNPYDANCVRVVSPRGVQIGNVSRRVAAWMAERLDRGGRLIARIHAINSGPKQMRGVVLLVTTEAELPDVDFEFDPDLAGYDFED